MTAPDLIELEVRRTRFRRLPREPAITNRERSNGRDLREPFLNARTFRLKLGASDVAATDNENDNDPAFLTAHRQEYFPHTPHRYSVANRVAHQSQRD
ncbi:hypothetical protein [Bradyrhizobium sp. B117]|uniref:hypothetical protein n=1 Tax=Bradyrhizobium sp. B117 TaxID=3140246 RepID=UPI003183AA27